MIIATKADVNVGQIAEDFPRMVGVRIGSDLVFTYLEVSLAIKFADSILAMTQDIETRKNDPNDEL